MKRVLFICILALSFFVFAAPVQAAPLGQDIEPLANPDALLLTFLSLTGVAALGAALANLAKQIKLPNGNPLLPDGKAPTFSLWYNLIGYAVLVILQTSGKADLIPIIDVNADLAAKVVFAVCALLGQLLVSRKAHDEVLAGMPVIGTSHSGKHAGDGVVVDVTQFG